MNLADIAFCVPILAMIGLILVVAYKGMTTKQSDNYVENAVDIGPETYLSTEFLANQGLEDLALDLQEEILEEWDFARNKFGAFNSAHEGFAVLHEEFDELKAEVWKNSAKYPERNAQMRKEAVQVAAMALRFLTDCCNHPENLEQ